MTTTDWREEPVSSLAIAIGLLWWHSGSTLGTGAGADGLPDVDYSGLVSRADLQYDKPVGRSEEGMPLGNGRMGSLVWTVPMWFFDLCTLEKETMKIANATYNAYFRNGVNANTRVFPAWPSRWDAAFTLLTRGAFLVGSSMQAGKIEFIRIESQAGGECRVRNPWPGATVALARSDNKGQDLSGDLLRFSTAKGEAVTIRPPR